MGEMATQAIIVVSDFSRETRCQFASATVDFV